MRATMDFQVARSIHIMVRKMTEKEWDILLKPKSLDSLTGQVWVRLPSG